MLLTTQEAVLRWCPMVRIGVLPQAGGPAAVNDPTTAFEGRCVSTDCAMWRWKDSEVTLTRGYVYPDPLLQPMPEDGSEPVRGPALNATWVWTVDEDDGGHWLEPREAFDARVERVAQARRGYCGLAGVPVHE